MSGATKYWETADGTEIPYEEIKDSHLLNILKWIEKKAKYGATTGCRGYEGDDDFITVDTWEIYGKEVKNEYDYYTLKREAKKRGLL